MSAAANGRWYRWELVGWLWLTFFLHQADRQAFNAVLPAMRAGLGLTDAQLGMVAMGFTLCYGLLVPVAGCVGDIASRKWVIIGCLVLFSLGTVMTGTVAGLVGLLLWRSAATGAGEAFYYPSGTSLLSHHHEATRARALGLHQTAQYIGIVGSSWLAGQIAERWGWRLAFHLFGGAGLVLAGALAWRLCPDPARTTDNFALLRDAARGLLRNRTIGIVTLAFGGMGFVTVGFLTWLPTYLYEQFQLPLGQAAFRAMAVHYLGAVTGVTIGSRLSDRLVTRRPQARLELVAIGMAGAAPFLYWLGTVDQLALVYAVLIGYGIFRGLCDANWMAGIMDVVPPRHRASTIGLVLCFAFVVASVAPYILGVLKPRLGLGLGLSALAVVYGASALLVWCASRTTFRADRDAAIASPAAL
jgi:MFS family permease